MRPPDENRLVPYYDFQNRKIVEIPVSELSANAIQVQVDGIEGLVWVNAGELKQSEPRHPPFSEQRRSYVQAIHEIFSEHRDLSYAEWEDGFRRDANPDSEIAIWLGAAEIYKQFTSDEDDFNRRSEVHKTLIACLTTTYETIWDVLRLEHLTESEAQKIIDRFHNAK